MANPLKIKTSSGTPNTTNFTGLQEMTDAEMNYIKHRVLVKFATESATGVLTGDINTSGTGDSIGFYTDTFLDDAVGTHPTASTESSTTTTLYQPATAVSESLVRPIEWISNSIKQQTDGSLNDSIISHILTDIASSNSTNSAIGTYYLSETATSKPSGTWTEKATIVDKLNDPAGTDVEYKLWRKSSDTTPTVIRPIKTNANSSLQEMTDADIESLVTRLRNRIIATGIGTYSFQENAPATGTWVQVGDDIVDRKSNVTAVQYTGTFAGQYTRQFTAAYTRLFSSQYTVQFARLTEGSQYTGTAFARLTTGPNYAQQFTRIYTAQYAQQFARLTTGPNYAQQFTRQYTAQYSVNYLRQYTAQYNGPQYNAQYARLNTGPQYNALYTRLNSGPQYTRRFTRNVTGPQYNANYARLNSGPQYTRRFTRIRTGPNYVTNYSAQYNGPNYTIQYSRLNTGPNYNVNYSAQYNGPNYTIQYSRLNTGPNYTVTNYAQYSTEQYNRFYTGIYNGPNYNVTYTAQYSGPNYLRRYSGLYIFA